ncbi:VacJ family lipoprotein [Candidatus Binatia bacterium]|jgi:phospholipid-binding lipoprotein MlaA|nr:VacJ family lipoprotein [Candidatus Binatia bacterium]
MVVAGLVAALVTAPGCALASARSSVRPVTAPPIVPTEQAFAPVTHEIELPADGSSGAPAEADAASAGRSTEVATATTTGTSGDQTAAPAAAAGSRTADDELELELDDRPTSFPDPFESVNRKTLSLNQTVDRWVVEPVADAYGAAMPDLAKKSVRDFLANLESPAILVNDILQGEMHNAAVTVGRFAVNTLIGCAGFFDPATSLGLERHSADFGQTLARTGFGSGPFLIVPLLGPTTVRDGLGTIVDIALQPAIYLLGPAPLVVASVQEGTVGLTMREKHGEDLKRLEQASLDYYAALRSAYYQDRMAKLADDDDRVVSREAEPSPPAPTAAAEPAT